MAIKTAVRERLASLLWANEIKAVQRSLDVLEDAWRSGPAVMTDSQIVRALQEADSFLLHRVLEQRGWVLATRGDWEYTEEDRLRAVREARRMYDTDMQTQTAVAQWTDFGFGIDVDIEPRDEALGEVFEEFWTARRNQPVFGQRNLHKLSTTLINDGEVFLAVFGSRIDGKATVRQLDTTAITEIITHPDDPDTPLYYVRGIAGKPSIYYPDWRATKEQLSLVDIPSNAILATDQYKKMDVQGVPTPVTSVMMVHLAYDERNGRGWPMFKTMYVWARMLQQFLENRAAVTRAVAAFVDEVIHPGGQRMQDALEARFSSGLTGSQWYDSTNPMPPAGSTLIHNKGIDVERRPLQTGATDALGDYQMFAGQVARGSRTPIHVIVPQAMSNRATAYEQSKPWYRALQRYQLLWTDFFTDLVEVVAMVHTLATGTEFDDLETDVSLQSPIDVSADEYAAAIGAVKDAAQAGAIPAVIATTAIIRLTERMLMALGIAPDLPEWEVPEKVEPEPETHPAPPPPPPPEGEQPEGEGPEGAPPEGGPEIEQAEALTLEMEAWHDIVQILASKVMAGEMEAEDAIDFIAREMGAGLHYTLRPDMVRSSTG